jgi:exopolyphosphatase/guanosine-5'-triphosphate,3'-diphosphate pyrophosphatase
MASAKKEKKKNKAKIVLEPTARQVAAIDIGTSAIRMALAEIDHDGQIRRLDTLNQSVSIGKDTFTTGMISHETIEECVRVLGSFKRVMAEYQVTKPDQIRAVATSAVREAANQNVFLDRIYMATGINVEAIDEAETTRLTYLGIQPYLTSDAALAKANNLVVEVGGGSTEFLQVSEGNIAYSHVYPMGSLRAVESGTGSTREVHDAMVYQMQVLIDTVREQLKSKKSLRLMIMGGEARFVARQIKPGWDAAKPARIRVAELASLTERLRTSSIDELVEEFHITYPDAETLVPALMLYSMLARDLNLKQVLVSGITMRDGLLMELVQRDAWSQEFNRQIVRSVKEFGLKFGVNPAHGEEVAILAVQLFDELQVEHELVARYRLVLEIAARLHEVGLFISDRSVHKHSMYIIQNSDIFGLGKKMAELVALVARYHHRNDPALSQRSFAALDREDRIAVKQLSAILRVADALGQSRRQRISEIVCIKSAGELTIMIPGVEDLTLEQLALQEKGTLFMDVFGLEVKFRKQGVSSS